MTQTLFDEILERQEVLRHYPQGKFKLNPRDEVGIVHTSRAPTETM